MVQGLALYGVDGVFQIAKDHWESWQQSFLEINFLATEESRRAVTVREKDLGNQYLSL